MRIYFVTIKCVGGWAVKRKGGRGGDEGTEGNLNWCGSLCVFHLVSCV